MAIYSLIVKIICLVAVNLRFLKDLLPFNFFVWLLSFEVYWQVVRLGLNHFWMNAALKRCKALAYTALIENYSRKHCTVHHNQINLRPSIRNYSFQFQYSIKYLKISSFAEDFQKIKGLSSEGADLELFAERCMSATQSDKSAPFN